MEPHTLISVARGDKSTEHLRESACLGFLTTFPRTEYYRRANMYLRLKEEGAPPDPIRHREPMVWRSRSRHVKSPPSPAKATTSASRSRWRLAELTPCSIRRAT